MGERIVLEEYLARGWGQGFVPDYALFLVLLAWWGWGRRRQARLAMAQAEVIRARAFGALSLSDPAITCVLSLRVCCFAHWLELPW